MKLAIDGEIETVTKRQIVEVCPFSWIASPVGERLGAVGDVA